VLQAISLTAAPEWRAGFLWKLRLGKRRGRQAMFGSCIHWSCRCQCQSSHS